MAAARTYPEKAGRRPKRSAIQPQLMYPRNAPNCMVKIEALVRRMLSPAPPCDFGAERNPGSQVASPQYAKSTEVASTVAKNVRRASGGRKSAVMGLNFVRLIQISGSFTLR